jgi:hypothetical protein
VVAQGGVRAARGLVALLDAPRRGVRSGAVVDQQDVA